MQILDLTNQYLSEFLNNRNRAAYESSFPELFDHYYRFWTKKELVPAKAGLISI